ncbi:MAG: glycosyltransferase [Verrucomicrobiales bacterium]|nr:glycosyltransferase [Verrucomicrobiales bacterium]
MQLREEEIRRAKSIFECPGNAVPDALSKVMEEGDTGKRVCLLFMIICGRIALRSECYYLESIFDRRSLCELIEICRTFPSVDSDVVVPKSKILIDVTHTMGYSHLSGIQRTVYVISVALEQKWDVIFVKNVHEKGLTPLSDVEAEAFLGKYAADFDGDVTSGECTLDRDTLIWPEYCTLLCSELLDNDRVFVYYGLLKSAAHSVAVFYDLIPITHPQYCHPGIVGAHVEYAGILSGFDRVLAISASACAELRGFLASSGKRHEHVEPLLLPDFNCFTGDCERGEKGRPRIAYISTMDPRKNHLRLFAACEELWTSGMDFELHLIGGVGWRNEVHQSELHRLVVSGYPVIRPQKFVSDREIMELYFSCDATVFCSEAEGYGLPIIESLGLGVPAIVSNCGSMKELADLCGGCHLIDPFDVGSIKEGIKTVLTDDEYRGGLKSSIDLSGLPSVEQYVLELMADSKECNVSTFAKL